MKKESLVNEYGSCFGIQLTFDTYAEMREYEKKELRVIVLENIDPDGFLAKLRQQGFSDEEIRGMGVCIK